MLARALMPALLEALSTTPAVVLLGPRQVGKTTLALALADSLGKPAHYLDLESDRDRARIAQPELYLGDHLGELIILDEVHRLPGLFPVLRGLIDRQRRAGYRSGHYLLLGSASLELLRQSGETLAGRVTYYELAPFNLLEVPGISSDVLWVRGGFPESLLADNDVRSMRWRQDFVRTYLERDIPSFGPRIAAETLRRFWTMLAHHQGAPVNAASLARSLGVDTKTVANYLDLLVDLLLVRRLPPWLENQGKRLVRSPKIYVRDSGLVHTLLAIPDKEVLLSHPIVGASWEGFCIETLLNCAPSSVQAHFYRSSGGAEIDLLLQWPNGERWAIEIKRSLSPKVERGFHAACEDLRPSKKLVIYPGQESYRITEDIEVMNLGAAARLVLHGPTTASATNTE